MSTISSDSTSCWSSTQPTPRSLDDDPFNFTEKPFRLPAVFYGNPLSWMALFRKDLYLTSMCATSHPHSGLKLSSLNLTEQDNNFLQKWRKEGNGTEVLMPFSDKGGKNELFKPLHNDVDKLTESEFMEKLRECLSDSKLVWLLVDRFFNSEVYLMMPFVNKEQFLKSLGCLIGERSDRGVNLKLRQTADLAIIGLLLIIMRLTSASLYNFEKKLYTYYDPQNMDGLQHMLDHPTSKEIFPLIAKITKEIQKLLIADPSLEIFEYLLMVSYFDVFDPENCDCIKTPASLNLSMLLRYAMQCSLHRDPDVYTDDYSGAQILDKDLVRRLWWGLVGLDLYQYLMIGNPRLIDPKISDTRLPTLDKNDEENYLLNKSINDNIQFYQSEASGILDLLLAIQPKATFADIKAESQTFKRYIGTLRSVGDIASAPCDTIADRYENLKDYLLLLLAYTLDFMVMYHFFLRYNTEKDYDLSFKYLLDCTESFNKLYETSILFLDTKNTKYNFQRVLGSGILAFPKLEAALHKSSLLPFTIISRFRASLVLGDRHTPDEANLFERMFQLLEKIIKHNLSVYLKISHVYYHIWIISKVHGLMVGQTMNSYRATGNLAKDAKFIAYIENLRYGDSGFKHLRYWQLILLLEKLEATSKICDVVDDPLDENLASASSPEIQEIRLSNADMVLQNDRRWLDRMLKEFNTSSPRTATSRSIGYVDPIPSKRVKLGYNTLKVSSFSNDLISGTQLDNDDKFAENGNLNVFEDFTTLGSIESPLNNSNGTITNSSLDTGSEAGPDEFKLNGNLGELLNSNVSALEFGQFDELFVRRAFEEDAIRNLMQNEAGLANETSFLI